MAIPPEKVRSDQGHFVINGKKPFLIVPKDIFQPDLAVPNWDIPVDVSVPWFLPEKCWNDGNFKYFVGFINLPGQSREALYQCPTCKRYKVVESQK